MKTIVRAWRSRSGVSAVEFALVAPIFALILAGIIDLGNILHARFQFNSVLSSGANYALVAAEDIDGGNVEDVTRRLAAVLISTAHDETLSIDANVNNAMTMRYRDGKAQLEHGDGEAASCYCPDRRGVGLDWGSPMQCGSVCEQGGIAGKFTTVTMSRHLSPLFGGFGMIKEGQVASTTVVQIR